MRVPSAKKAPAPAMMLHDEVENEEAEIDMREEEHQPMRRALPTPMRRAIQVRRISGTA